MVTALAQPDPARVAERFDARRGVYDARRAAALSGVPKRTLSYWAAKRIYTPSVSPEPRTRLWSWYDLLALRTIDWLRRPDEGARAVPFGRIREMLRQLDQRGFSRADLHNLVVRTTSGEVYLSTDEHLIKADASGQSVMPDMLAVVRPYKGAPDLLEPRPLLRIIPGKLSGEPHVAGTRIATPTIYALQVSGYALGEIQAMYPEASEEALSQAIELERSLQATAA